MEEGAEDGWKGKRGRGNKDGDVRMKEGVLRWRLMEEDGGKMSGKKVTVDNSKE